jgi:Cytochrome c554 and c-prime
MIRLRRSPRAPALVLVLLMGGTVAGGPTSPSPDGPSVRNFLDRHWRRPIAPQGTPPADFSPLEASLAPQSCGTCHPAQLSDWRTTLHASAMGPGVTGQLVELWRNEPESARQCLRCHAPLAEQQPDNRAIFDPSLQREGVVCAGCHVREHARFGPPRREQPAQSSPPTPRLPHGGAMRTPAFTASEFCSSCHQFDSDGFALNGKLLENTYEEWKASPAAGRGMQCQGCHMPDRRHLFRGIHDPEMVRSAVAVSVVTQRRRHKAGDDVAARITLTTPGVGHHFPTYVTPRVVVRAALVDSAGREVPGTAEERVIARDVSLDLSRELSDTRLPAGGRFVLDYRRRVERAGLRLRVRVTVYPDHFYTEFFESLLSSGAGRGKAEIQKALEATRRSAFELYRRDIPLT